ncbi:MAG: CotH kinase family protein [Muribaculaceae bacterium]|nr:CotH kinase family protein [Muribaculaceae bacterium]
MNKFLHVLLAAAALSSAAQAHELYLRGDLNGWSLSDQFTREGDLYSIHLPSLDGSFKIATSDWATIDLGAPGYTDELRAVTGSGEYFTAVAGPNFEASGLSNVVISLTIPDDLSQAEVWPPVITVACDQAPLDPDYRDYGERSTLLPTRTLPTLYIETADIMRWRNLPDKSYRDGVYWLEPNGHDVEALGSADEPLPLEIKARGNYTRTAYSKKPYKLKLGKKQKLCGLSKSKHFALLAHADDDKGFMRNFVGFNLGKRIGLPWTPSEYPVELVINGDYRGLYFLTESIRVEDGRIEIAELEDEETNPILCSGGYLVELDNYVEDNQIRMPEAGGWATLMITQDTPEVYSPIQTRFVTDQFTAMNSLVENRSDELWSYLDLDAAARYYIVEESIDHWESYHGSTYLFRDRGEGQKWIFSPLWDCGNAFTTWDCESYFTHRAMFGNTWIGLMRENARFMAKVKETWRWFEAQCLPGIENDIDSRADMIRSAAMRDALRWKDAPRPDASAEQTSPQRVKVNEDLDDDVQYVKGVLARKTQWLANQWKTQGSVSEPSRDLTPAAPLPEYVLLDNSVNIPVIEEGVEVVAWHDMMGRRLVNPAPGTLCIATLSDGTTRKLIIR